MDRANAERLEEIKIIAKWAKIHKDELDHYFSCSHLLELLDNGHLEWLIEQAERLHGDGHRLGYIEMYDDCNRTVGNDSIKINTLKRRVQELEEDRDRQWKCCDYFEDKNHELEQQNKRYREALRNIRKEGQLKNFHTGRKSYNFQAKLADQALEGEEC